MISKCLKYVSETYWVCERGKIALNRRRIRCKKDPEKGFFWDKKLSKCIECEPNKPSAQKNVILKCKINAQYGLRQCLVKCKSEDALLAGYPKDHSFETLTNTLWVITYDDNNDVGDILMLTM